MIRVPKLFLTYPEVCWSSKWAGYLNCWQHLSSSECLSTFWELKTTCGWRCSVDSAIVDEKRQKEKNPWEVTKRWAVTILFYGYLHKLILGETLFHNPYRYKQMSGVFLLPYAHLFWVALSQFHPVITAADCGNRGRVPYFLCVPANLITAGADGSQQWRELQILPALKFFQLDVCLEVHVSSYFFLPGTWLLKRVCCKSGSFVLSSLNIWFLALNFGAVYGETGQHS